MTLATLLLLLLFVLVLVTYSLYVLYAIVSAAPYVPVSQETAHTMIAMSELKEGEELIDLGSGDGRVLFAGAKTGADCTGIEINPVLVLWSRFLARCKSLPNVQIVRQDLWKTDLSEVDVLTLYFIRGRMEKLKEKIQREMKPGSRIVSYAFTFPGWNYEKKDGKVYLYVLHSSR